MKKLKIVFWLMLISLVVISCFVNKDKKNIHRKPKRVLSNNILIILGEFYYEQPDVLNYLKKEYGLGEENAKIEVLSYDDMLSGKRLYLRSMYDKISEQKSDIVIGVGLPEGSGRYFIKAHHKFPDAVFVSLLPMEDVLPLEAACDFVVDYGLPDTMLNDEQEFSISSSNLELLLVASLFAAEDMKALNKQIEISPYEEFRRAFFLAKVVLYGKKDKEHNFHIKTYVDPESALPSRKYFIVQEILRNDNE